MNIARSFVEYMEDLSMGTFGTDIFVGNIAMDAPNKAWWVLSSGGVTFGKNSTGERIKNYTLSVYYRNTDAEDVYETMQEFEDEINSKHCVQLDTYDTIEMEASVFPTDQDLDNEDRVVGLMQIKISVYQS